MVTKNTGCIVNKVLGGFENVLKFITIISDTVLFLQRAVLPAVSLILCVRQHGFSKEII